MKNLVFRIAASATILALFCSFAFASRITEKFCDLKKLYENEYSVCFVGDDSAKIISSLGFCELFREEISGVTYLYGKTAFSNKSATSKNGRFNCQIAVKKNGVVKVGMPLIDTGVID